MKTKIKIKINGNEYELEYSYEQSMEGVIKFINSVIESQKKLEEGK